MFNVFFPKYTDPLMTNMFIFTSDIKVIKTLKLLSINVNWNAEYLVKKLFVHCDRL